MVQFSKRLPAVAPNGLWTATEVGNALGGNPLAADTHARRVDTFFDNLGRKSTVIMQSVADPALITADNAAGIARYDYDSFGGIVHEATKINNLGAGDFNGPGTWRNTFHYFDQVGHEILTVDPLGYQTKRKFDPNGNLTSLTEFATAGTLAVIGSHTPPPQTQTSPDDRSTNFYYDTLNRQVMVQRLGLRYAGASGDNAEQTPTTVSQTGYDHTGNVVSQTDALGNITTRAYDMLGWMTKVTEPARVTAGTSLDPFPAPVTVSPVTTYTLNAFGQVVTQVRDPAGGAGGTLISVNGYDFVGNLISTTDANHVSVDNLGNIVADHTFDKVRRYDYAGRVIEERQAIDVQLGNWQHVSQTLTHRFAYDAAGHQIADIDVYDGGTQQTGQRSIFNTFGEIAEQQRVWGSATNAWGGTTADVDALSGHAISASFEFDNAGRLETQTAGDGITKFFYNMAGQVTRQEQHGETVRVTETDYDDRGNAITQRQPTFDAAFEQGDSMQLHSAITPFVDQQFDRWGNVISRSVGGYLEQGQPQTGLQATTRYHYNHDNQVIAEIAPVTVAGRDDGSFYNARVTHEMSYDLLGRLVQEQDIADDMGTEVNEATVLRTRTREYNAVGLLTAETDAEGHTTSYAYNAHGNRVATKNALGTVYVDTFDKTGNVLTHGVLRLSTEENGAPYVSGGATPPVLRVLNEYDYDQSGRRVRSSDVLDTVSFGQITHANTFTRLDERGLVLAELNPNGILTQYQYDQFGLKTSEQLGSDPGNLQTWTYSDRDYSVGRMDTASAGTNTTTYFYNAFGQVGREEYSAEDNVRRYSYYDNGLLQRIDDTLRTGTKGGADLRYYSATESTSYKYDVKGQVVEEHFDRVGEQDQMVFDPSLRPLPTWVVRAVPLDHIIRTTFTRYDARGRVTRVWAPPGPQGSPLNNGLTMSGIDYEYDEFGDVRHISAPDTDSWFTYNKEGLITIADGEKTADGITEGTKGTKIGYDELERRSTTEIFQGHNSDPVQEGVPTNAWDEYRLEKYSYDDLDHLRLIQQKIDFRNGTTDGNANDALNGESDWFKQEERTRVDIRGTVLERQTYSRIFAGFSEFVAAPAKDLFTSSAYREDGKITSQTTSDNNGSPLDVLSSFNYRDDGLLQSYFHSSSFNGSLLTDDKFTYQYGAEIGGIKEEGVDVVRTVGSPDAKPGSTVDAYDVRGRLKKVVFTGTQQKETTRTFAYNAAGQAIVVEEKVQSPDSADQPGTQALFYTNGKQVGTVGTGTLLGSHFSFAYTPITDASGPSTYTVRSGDSLGSIALAVYGDASLWYLIADANSISLAPNVSLPSAEQGRVYRIPTLVRSHNTADTFKPYNPAEVIGNTTPSPVLPAPPGSACGPAGQILATVVIAIVVAVVTYYTGGLATGALTSAFGVEAGTGGAVVAGAVGSGIGAAAGNAAGQGVGNLLGVQDGFNTDSFLAAGASGALGSVFSGALDQTKISFLQGDFARGAANAFGGYVGNGLFGQAGTPESALYSFATQYASSAAFDSGLKGKQPGFSLRDELVGFLSSSLNPDSGWVFNPEKRDWAHIAISVLQPLASQLGTVLGSKIPLPSQSSRTGAGQTIESEGKPLGSALQRVATWSDIPTGRELQFQSWSDYKFELASNDDPAPRAADDDYSEQSSFPDEYSQDSTTSADQSATTAGRGVVAGVIEERRRAVEANEAAKAAEAAKVAEAARAAAQERQFAIRQAAVRADDAQKASVVNYSDQVSVNYEEQVSDKEPGSPKNSEPVTLNIPPEYELDREAVESLGLETIREGSDVLGAVNRVGEIYTEIARDTATHPITSSIEHARDFNDWLKELGYDVRDAAETLDKAEGTAAREVEGIAKAFHKVDKIWHGIGTFADVVGVVTEFSDRVFGNASPAQTTAGKVVDGTISAGLNYILGNKLPIISGADALQDRVFGFKPVPISDTNRGASSAISVTLEGLVTGETTGGDEFTKRARDGQWGWIIGSATQAGVEAVDRNGATRDLGWKFGQFFANGTDYLQFLERPAALTGISIGLTADFAAEFASGADPRQKLFFK